MAYAINTYLPDFEVAQDRAKRNSGGLHQSGTLIEQGDSPVNVVDLETDDQQDLEMRSEFPELFEDEGSRFLESKRSEGDLQEGVSMVKPMYKERIRRTSN